MKKYTINVKEFAEVVGISKAAAYAAVRRGEIEAKTIGRRIIIPIHVLDTWLGEAYTEDGQEGPQKRGNLLNG